jgi:hypothetical protein
MIEVRFSAHSLAGAMLIAIECRIAPVSCNQRRNLANSGAKSQYRSIFSPDIRLAIFGEIEFADSLGNGAPGRSRTSLHCRGAPPPRLERATLGCSSGRSFETDRANELAHPGGLEPPTLGLEGVDRLFQAVMFQPILRASNCRTSTADPAET